MNNVGQKYASRKSFIEGNIASILSAKQDFDSIKYARSAITDAEYIRIADITGRAVTFNITGNSLEDIVNDVARIILMDSEKVHAPSGVVTDIEEMRRLAPLFK